MKTLFQFIFKHNFFFLFLLFEGLSLTLYIQNNYYPQSKFFSITSEISGSYHKTTDNLFQYLSLKQSNKELAENNARLISQSFKSYVKIDTNTYLINDSLYKQQYKYYTAKVINSSVNKKNNYLTLNKGSKEGIEKDMAVITSSGIVGIVKSVSYNFASVISVLNSKSKISAKIKKNNYTGSVIWEGMNYENGILKDIPSHVKLIKGDTIVTSGYSNIFPEGIPIGTVLHFKKEKGDNFYTIYIKFSCDYDKLSYVYLIKNNQKKEQDKLEQTSQND